MPAPRHLLTVSIVIAALLAACQRAEPPKGADRHPLKGRVVAVDVASRQLTVAHEDIPGFMPAMTMPFTVASKDAVLLGNVSPGDEVSAELVVSDSRYWVENLVVLKKAVAGPPGLPAPPVREARPGDPRPDVALVDQDGRPFRLRDYQGRGLALTFVYTRCPLPDFCPLMMRNFAAAESLLERDDALRTRTHLLTVSFDPRHDTPDVLRAFGRPFQTEKPPFRHWSLATGKAEAIRELARALELEYSDEDQTFTHNLRTAVYDGEGRLVRLFRGNDWKPEELVAALREAAGR
jgi:protein SCO1/2